MNRPLKNLLRIAGIAVGVGAAVWAMRDKLLPAPDIPDEPPPRFRTGPAPSDGSDDITEIKGIGPAYAGRLADQGITTFTELAAADIEDVAAAARVSPARAGSWIEAAGQRS